MKMDFHCHILLTNTAPFNIDLFEKTIRQSKKMGLNALAITEHMSALHFEQIFDYLDKTYTYKNLYFDLDGFRIYTGMEIEIENRGHILVIGYKNDIIKLRKILLKTYIDDVPTLEQLLAETRSYNIFIIGAHPYRFGRELTTINELSLRKLDAFDLNGQDIDRRNDTEYLAQSLNVPLVGGSNTHLYIQAGVIQTHFEKPFETIEELKFMLKNNQPHITSHSLIKYKIKFAEYEKSKLEKKLYSYKY
ncbi:MAG: hypothetical protein ATN36_06445 [Epulopiscium sp. Nele67-Bin005]|nr:MAG: hypothetical protein ATN36_06445 [Epulopiscium sp. Nele67-Bin005]